jgi:hypothetical protein
MMMILIVPLAPQAFSDDRLIWPIGLFKIVGDICRTELNAARFLRETHTRIFRQRREKARWSYVYAKRTKSFSKYGAGKGLFPVPAGRGIEPPAPRGR